MSDLLDDLLDVLEAGGSLVTHHHRLPILFLTPQTRLNTSQSILCSITSHLSAVVEVQFDDISDVESSSSLEAAIFPGEEHNYLNNRKFLSVDTMCSLKVG